MAKKCEGELEEPGRRPKLGATRKRLRQPPCAVRAFCLPSYVSIPRHIVCSKHEVLKHVHYSGKEAEVAHMYLLL